MLNRRQQKRGSVARSSASKPSRPSRRRTARNKPEVSRLSKSAARESDQWYRLIVDNVRDFAIFSADRNGKISSWNPGAERPFCILCVDDDENDLQLVKFAAEPAGISRCLLTVDSGPRAIDYFQGHGAYGDRAEFPIPHVVLLDLRMPRMNGLEVLGWLRSRPEFRGVVVVIFTASAHPDDVTRACELGANAFVQKPSSHAELVNFLKVVKEFWRGFHLYPTEPERLGGLAKPTLTP